MNQVSLRAVAVFAIAGLLALVVGYAIATGSYAPLFLMVCLALGLVILVSSGYVPLLAIGIVTPFTLPLPFVSGFPFLLFILLVCCAKYLIVTGIYGVRYKKDAHALTPAVGLFFGFVVLRYCLNPALPNLQGFGANVTGFRSYLGYALCFAVVLLLGVFVRKREDFLRLLKWMIGLSIAFTLCFIPFIFTKSLTIAWFFSQMGMYVTTFDNGMLRFVALPTFGLLLLSVSLLPSLFPVTKPLRRCIFILGLLTIVLAGNRSSVIMAFVVICGVPIIRKQYLRFATIAVLVLAFIGVSRFIGDRLSLTEGAGFLRILALTSKRIASQTDADYNVQWRKMRWERAIEEIKANPFFGKGYGGLDNAFIVGSYEQIEEARLEVDIASGGVHNGYLGCALALGIPALIVFCFVLGFSILQNIRIALQQLPVDRLQGELHAFIAVNLVALAITIYIGTDLNNPLIWLYIASGTLLHRFSLNQARRSKDLNSRQMSPRPTQILQTT